MKPLPIGTQDFPKLIETGLLYVDKTASIHCMIQEGSVYFLSRPRRFGKSLLVSTLRAIFEGRRELFKGLAIDALPYEWKPHPVLHLDLGAERFASSNALQAYISDELDRFATVHGVGPEGQTATARFRNALSSLIVVPARWY